MTRMVDIRNIYQLRAYRQMRMVAYLLLIEWYLFVLRRQCAFTKSIPDGSSGILLIDNIVIEMSELIDPATVNNNTVVVKDSAGNIVEGEAYLAGGGKTIVFVPTYGYDGGKTYTITLNGVKDWGGNTISGYTSHFTTFEPQVFPNIANVPVAMAIEQFRNYIVVKGVDTSLGDITRYSTIWIFDVTNPENPVLVSSTNLYAYIHDIKAVTDVTIAGITGDFVVAVGGRDDREGSLYTLDVTDPYNPTIVGYIYLSWSPAYGAPPPNVPYDSGEPYEVALIDTYAYVANHGVGLQAIDLVQVVAPWEAYLLEKQSNPNADPNKALAEAQAAIIGTLTGTSYMSVSKVRNNVLAVRNGAFTIARREKTKGTGYFFGKE